MSTSQPEPPSPVAPDGKTARAARSYRARKDAKRAARRQHAKAMAVVPVDAKLKRFDPLDQGEANKALTVALAGVLIVGAVALHAVILGAFLGASAILAEAEPVQKDAPITVAIIEPPPPPPEPEPPPPEPEPAAEPEPEVEVAEPEPPEPEPEPEPVKPPPKKEPPKPKVVEKPPPPPPPDPINEPEDPPEPPKEEPRRIVGLNMESTVTGGDGPAFATGNTRSGVTGKTAEDPNKVKKIPPGAKGGDPRSSAGDPKDVGNKVSNRIPVQGVKYTKPQIKGGKIQPAYPAMLKRRGIEADVVVMVTVSAEGVVTAVRIVKGASDPAFNQAAQQAAMRQRFIPATKNGSPIPYNVKYTYRFRING